MDYNKYLYWVWLNEIEGVGPVTARSLLNKFCSPENIYYVHKEELITIKGIGDKVADNILNSKSLEKAKVILEKCYKLDINLTTYNESNFPNNISKINDCPILLYYKGTIGNDNGVAIVGARRCTQYGKTVSAEAAKYLALNRITVISGMAAGIDSYAHAACIKEGGYTIGFLGCGVDICYPKEHRELYEAIIDNGGVVSEYSPGEQPNKKNFPKRNRLIAACSSKLLVVEATEKSGALITAEYAKKYSKEVYAAPNSIYSRDSLGCNKLIMNGAKVYLEPEQLLLEQGNLQNNTKYSTQINMIENEKDSMEIKVLTLLKNSKLNVDELSYKTKINRSEIMNILFELEIEGKVKCVRGRYIAQGYCKI